MRTEYKVNAKSRFGRYVEEVVPAIAGLVLLTLMTHGSILFTQRIGIDTENIIMGVHNFDGIGRQGLIWLANLLGTGWFSPYLAQVLTIVFMIGAPVGFGFLFYTSSGQKTLANITLLVLGASYIVSPFWTEQLYFFNQSTQITCACLLTAVSIRLAEESRQMPRERWYCILGAVVLMQLIFSSYQVLVMMYVTGVAMVFLCSALKEDRGVGQQLQWILAHTVIFLVGLGTYWFIAKRFYGNGMDYLNGQVGWNDLGIMGGIKSCVFGFLAALKNNPPYYTGFYGIFAAAAFVSAAYRGVRSGRLRKEWRKAVLFYLTLLFLAGAPFVFGLVYGGEILARMQLTLPLSQGCMLYLTVLFLFGGKEKGIVVAQAIESRSGHGNRRGKYLYWGIALTLLLAVLRNTLIDMSYCNRLYYTDEWRYEYDRQLAHDIYMELKEYIEESGYEKELYKKLVFIGTPAIAFNGACLKGEVIGRSSFEWDIRHKSVNRGRILNFMKAVGYPVEPAPEFTEGATAAYFAYFEEYFGERADAMPSFPDSGSIQYLESEEIGLSYLVVKLGTDWRVAFE